MKGELAYLPLRSSTGSGGSTTSLPSTGKAFSSMLNPAPSLCGKAAPILVQRLFGIPCLTPSSLGAALKGVLTSLRRQFAFAVIDMRVDREDVQVGEGGGR